ncbi:toxin YoeB [Pedobacter psychrotolerans]|uniref:Putative mRNA interferase YoeB n=1 Tax=Pedobacter psychrotolerans TaxID=1843235 RepID=A0A4R2HIS0_9SPHI|nr:Txe/YoeB family addiction module toxin [Pedobacter psychrotolerans]TCO29194.1 toxin YoeB [Pedobacter psychrotolerans]GGE54905.1 Txe/YoeB family addiction module toxin [Pedobacter psychrotolerans]
MEVVFLPTANEDLIFWKKSGNITIQNKIHQLLIAISNSPFEGIGKPEALKHKLTGKWSRRINSEHRIVYEVLEKEQIIKIHSLKSHYN